MDFFYIKKVKFVNLITAFGLTTQISSLKGSFLKLIE